ncbi:MAG: agrobactine synthetase subunit F [Gammaproteobacteria bacterium]|nr:agrobactine synthetase subunit F [Gammaproteobacteria bacterium]
MTENWDSGQLLCTTEVSLPEAKAGPAATGDRMPLTEQEQRLWLQQVQHPETPFSCGFALRLQGILDAVRLQQAWLQVLDCLTELTLVYRLDDDGHLRRAQVSQAGTEFQISHHDSYDQALDVLLERQGWPWDLESQPPYRLQLMLLPQDEALLNVDLHLILAHRLTWATLLTSLSSGYNGVASLGQVLPNQDKAPLWIDPGSPLRCVQRPAAHLPIHIWNGATAGGPERGSNCIGTRLDRSALQHPSLTTAGATTTLMARLSVLWGQWLATAEAAEHVTLMVLERGIAPGLPIDDGQVRCLGMATSQDVISAADALLLQPSSAPCQDGGLSVVITWLEAVQCYLPLAGLIVRHQPRPSFVAEDSLQLAIGLNDAQVQLQLMVGSQLSPAAVGWLLECFVAHLGGSPLTIADIVLPQAMPEPPQQVQEPGAQQHIERAIIEEFRLALGVADLDADQDFFDAGGHSLIATRVIGRLLALHGIEVRFNDLFANPTAAALAKQARLVDQPSTQAEPQPQSLLTTAPLSLAQHSLWKVYAALGFGEIFNIPFALRFIDPVDEHVFQQAFLDLLVRHTILRSHFYVVDDEPRQRVVPVSELERYHWFWFSADDPAHSRQHEAQYRFDLAEELPLRVRFMRDHSSGQQLLSLLFHHIVLDEWSVNLLIDELCHAYRQRQMRALPLWCNQPRPFHEFARQQRQNGIDPQKLGYWISRLQGTRKAKSLFGDEPDGDQTSSSSINAEGGWVEIRLSPATITGLYALAKGQGASLFNVAYACIASALCQQGGLPELVIGTSASGRNDPAFFDTVGYFTTVVAHKVQCNQAMTVSELVTQVKNTINDSMPYTDIPIDLVEEALLPGGLKGGEHLFEVFIQIHAKNKLNGAIELADGQKIRFCQVDPEKSESLLGLQFEVMEELVDGERDIRVLMSYRSDHYRPCHVERLQQALQRAFAAFATRPADSSLAELWCVWESA